MSRIYICDEVGGNGVLQMRIEHKNKERKISTYEQYIQGHMSRES